MDVDNRKMEKHVLKERMKSLDLCDSFQKVFGVRLIKFWSGNITGFDIVGFDEHLRVPNNVSLATHIQETYGQRGTDIINALLA